MTLTFPFFDFSKMVPNFRTSNAKPANDVIPQSDAAFTDREFLNEVMARNPEAIQSDHCLMAMMSENPGQF